MICNENNDGQISIHEGHQTRQAGRSSALHRSWKTPAVAAGGGAGGKQGPGGGSGGADAAGGLLRDAPLGRRCRLWGRPRGWPPAGSQALPVLLLCLLHGAYRMHWVIILQYCCSEDFRLSDVKSCHAMKNKV